MDIKEDSCVELTKSTKDDDKVTLWLLDFMRQLWPSRVSVVSCTYHALHNFRLQKNEKSDDSSFQTV